MNNVNTPREDIGIQKKSPQQSDQWDKQKANQNRPSDKEFERDPKSPFRPEIDPEQEVPDVQGDKEDLRHQ